VEYVYEAIRKVLSTKYHASPSREKYVVEAQFMLGDPVSGIKRMKERYSGMVNNPLSTLAESRSIESGSYNHGWCGCPLSILSQ
jgi:hypothetical protein